MLFCSCVFSPFTIAITSLGEERANLSAFLYVCSICAYWFCLFPLLLGVLEGLRLVLVALPGLFSYFFFILLTVLRRWSWCWSYPLLLCDLFYEAICSKPCLVLFCSCVFSHFTIAITSLGEERANLSAFSYVCSICACLVLSVSSFYWCLGRTADCGTPWTFLLPFLTARQIICT